MQQLAHTSVLLAEAIDALAIKPDGVYIDATFGRGGHSRTILSQLGSEGRLIGIDKDPHAIESAQQQFGQDPRFCIEQGSFTQLTEIAKKNELEGKIAGILLDLGVSSPQLEDPERGFSFLRDGPLDMRMDPTQGIGAATWINHAKEEEIANVLYEYGEERFSRRIAHAIVKARQKVPFTTTLELATVIKAANPKWEKDKHPATRSFQAIRIFINSELEDLQACLKQAIEVLEIGGRLAVISFHSLEDRIVKRFLRECERGPSYPRGLPVTAAQCNPRLRHIGRAVKPSVEEVEKNVRARSAVLRIAENLS